MRPPMNIDPEVLKRIIEQYQTQVPTGIAPQGFPTYGTIDTSPQIQDDSRLTTQPQFDVNQTGFTQPNNLEELNELLRSGQIDQTQYEQLFETIPEFNYKNSNEQGVLADFQQYNIDNTPPDNARDFSQLFGSMGVGVSLDSALFNIGRFGAMDSDVSGRNLGLIGSIGKTLTSGARSIASGAGFSKRNEFVKDYYRDEQKDVQYTPSPQYQNNNYTGGYSFGKYGGEFDGEGFQNGDRGEQNNFNGYKHGDPITFEYGGKIEKGIFDRMENGQIFLK